MNIFNVLGVNYEVFHTRMLRWLWSREEEHGAGDAFLCPFLQEFGVATGEECRVDAEVKIGAKRGGMWRLADLILRTADTLILVENKVDPGYQDVDQILDEIEGGRVLADEAGLRFVFVLIAPGPLSTAVQAALDANGGRFLAWSRLIELLNGVPREKLAPTVADVIGQYVTFCEKRKPSSTSRPVADSVLRDSEAGLRALVEKRAAGGSVTAEELWPEFLSRFPDHVAALNDRWAETQNYSTKVWFAWRLQKMASEGDLLAETGEWQKTAPSWGYPQVRIYRRLQDDR